MLSDREFVSDMRFKFDCLSEAFTEPEVERLIDIIERQAKALEKCKEQRDSLVPFSIDGLYPVDDFNKELDTILEGEKA